MKPVSIIAEAGVNHTGDLDKALRQVDAAADAGADRLTIDAFGAGDLASTHAAHAPKERPSLELTLPGPDDRACLTPGEFARMVEDIRSAETALGDNVELLTPGELNTVRLAKDEPIP